MNQSERPSSLLFCPVCDGVIVEMRKQKSGRGFWWYGATRECCTCGDADERNIPIGGREQLKKKTFLRERIDKNKEEKRKKKGKERRCIGFQWAVQRATSSRISHRKRRFFYSEEEHKMIGFSREKKENKKKREREWRKNLFFKDF